MKYDIIIVGCGISSLYYLYMLQKMNSNAKIAVLEKRPYCGGRIHSIKIGDDIIDSGALRFNKNHKHLLQLLDELGITNYAKLASKKSVTLSKTLLDKWGAFLRKTSHKKYADYPFSSVAKLFFTKDDYSTLKLWFGYDEEWEHAQCYHLSKTMLSNFDAEEYYYFPQGYSIVPDAVYSAVKDNKNYHFHFGKKVVKIADPNNIYTADNNHFTADHIIFACPPHYISNIQGTEELAPLIGCVGWITLNRIYAKIKNHGFPNKAIHSKNPICQIVPINEDIVMISYSTGEDAKFWIEQEQNGTLWKTLRECLATYFPDGVKKPEWIRQNYWNPATHYFRSGVIPVETQYKSFQPCSTKKWYIIGEAFSLNQGWVNGALENTKAFLSLCDKNGLPAIPNYERKIKLKEVAKHGKKGDAWIALFGNVYDVTDWISIHPGGDVILYGIGKDATDMFTGVGHQEDALQFMEKYKIGILE
jgi:monoamine oxidase/predicted heme/steroid binding protein